MIFLGKLDTDLEGKCWMFMVDEKGKPLGASEFEALLMRGNLLGVPVKVEVGHGKLSISIRLDKERSKV